MTPFTREAIEVEALRTDRYLEALLAQRDGASLPGVDPRATGLPAVRGSGRPGFGGPAPERLDPALLAAIGSLDRALVRVHPSFRFEERLARRLAEVADAMRVSAAAGAEGADVPVVLPFDTGQDPADPGLTAPWTALPAVPRPLLIGAASAALSLAGAAIVAWRFGRPGDPMARAARTAHQLRAAGRPHVARVD